MSLDNLDCDALAVFQVSTTIIPLKPYIEVCVSKIIIEWWGPSHEGFAFAFCLWREIKGIGCSFCRGASKVVWNEQ